MDKENIIIIDSDEEEDDCIVLALDESCVFVDDASKKDDPTTEENNTSEIVDEDLAVTFSKKAAVMPHARYDCSIHLFSPMENETNNPGGNNEAFCEQCFCYICDKLASECTSWRTCGLCHCNAHKRSAFWKDQRDKAVLGYLHIFKFDLLEVDSELRRAESLLLRFEEILKEEYGRFLKGAMTSLSVIISCLCHCHAANSLSAGCKKCKSRHVDVVLYDYSKVYDLVSEFLHKALEEKPRTAAVMLLGAAKNFIFHTQPSPGTSRMDDKACVSDAIPALLLRVTDALQYLMVAGDFSPSFTNKLQYFFQSLWLPVKCRWLSDRLNVLLWEDPLLVAVLNGQNTTGTRVLRGKRRETLSDPAVAVQARAGKLKEQNRYRELARYLKVVRSDNSLVQGLRDQIPFFLCKAGDYCTALQSFYSSTSEMCCTACRLSPKQFAVYLKILTTGKMPVGKDPFLSTEWETVKDASLPRTSEIIKYALRILNCNIAVYMDSESWVNLISAASWPVMAEDGSLTCTSFLMPDFAFQEKARYLATAILQDGSQIQITKSFLKTFPDQALLLLVTQSLALRIFHCPMGNILDVIRAFKANAWALKWFFSSLSARPDVLQVFINSLLEELYRKKDVHAYWDVSEHTHIADFFLFYLLDKRPHFFSINSQILDDLLNHWNEHDFAWQYYLRRLLQQQEFDLPPDKRRFLDLIRMKKSEHRVE